MCDKKKLDITFTTFEKVCRFVRGLEGTSLAAFVIFLLIYPLSLPDLARELPSFVQNYVASYLSNNLIKALIIIFNIIYIVVVLARYNLYESFQDAVNQQIERIHSGTLSGDPKEYADIGKLSRPLFFKKKKDFLYGFFISILTLVSFLYLFLFH